MARVALFLGTDLNSYATKTNRRKIEKNPGEPQYIFTEVGVGYRMIEGD